MLVTPLTLCLPVLSFMYDQHVHAFVLDNNRERVTRFEYHPPRVQKQDVCFDERSSKNIPEVEGFSSSRRKRQADVLNYDFGKLSRLKIDKGQLIKYLLVPALVMSGLVPYILPPIKMAVMIVSLLTNMAFTSALFTLVRGYIFEPRPEEHNVVYYNLGYKKEKMKPMKEPHAGTGTHQNVLIVYPDEEKTATKIDDKVPIDVSMSAADQFEKINVEFR